MPNLMHRITMAGSPFSPHLSAMLVVLKSKRSIHRRVCFPDAARNIFPRMRGNCKRSQSILCEQNPERIFVTPSSSRFSPLLRRYSDTMSRRDLCTEELLFKILKLPGKEEVSVNQLLELFEESGISVNDSRLQQFMELLNEEQEKLDNVASNVRMKNFNFDKETFMRCVEPVSSLISRIVRNDFVITEWKDLTGTLTHMYNTCSKIKTGHVASYIPQLSRIDPNLWGVSVCSVDGQRFSLGDAEKRFCLQSAQFPLAYCLALDENDGEYVHSFVGHEPSGLPVSSISLNKDKKPHNPMISTGALVISSLISQKSNCIADRFDNVVSLNKRLSGNGYIGFDNATFLAERECGDRISAIGYILKEHKCFPKNQNITEILDFYFQLCSIETDCKAGAVIAATLANGGVCPTTGEQVFNPEAVRDTLSLMHSCGMYDYSGQFAFRVGLPAKSSVSGVILLVVPHVLGICMYSPPLDQLGNSVRGIRFCEELVNEFNFHNYDSLQFLQKKRDPRARAYDQQARDCVSLLFSSFHNDITALRREFLRGVNMEQKDYDGRTSLHIAAAEGHIDVVKFLINTCQVNKSPLDRWDSSPLNEAERFGHHAVADFLREA